MKYLSKGASIDALKLIFSGTSSDSITPKEAASAWGRGDRPDDKNRSWFDNKMTHLKYNSLIQPVYSRRNNRRVLSKIQLTLAGKEALGRISVGQTPTSTPSDRVSLDQIMKLITQLREENPDYKIIFEAKLKEKEE